MKYTYKELLKIGDKDHIKNADGLRSRVFKETHNGIYDNVKMHLINGEVA